MRSFFTIVILVLLDAGCRRPENAIEPLNRPVATLADLPTTYQPFRTGSAVAGRIKSETHNGQLSSEWQYNQRGQLLEWRHYQNGQVFSADQYRYDIKGHLRFVQHFGNNCELSSSSSCTGPVFWIRYDQLETDNAGRVNQSRTFFRKGAQAQWESRSSTTAYEYNAEHRLVNVLRYDANRRLAATETLTYDGQGNVITLREQSNVASADLADRTFQYTYDIGRNPYVNTVYYASPFFLSRNVQASPGITYEYRADSLPTRIRQNGTVTELAYY